MKTRTLQHLITAALVLVCGEAWAGNQVIVGPGSSSGGPIPLNGSGSAAAAIVAAAGGGSVAGQGQFQATAAASQFFGLDGSEQARVITMQGAVDRVVLEGGQSGFGSTIVAQSDTDANVDLVLAAQGTGCQDLGNGSGMGLQVCDAGGAAAANYTVYPGISGTLPKLSAPGNAQIDVATTGYVEVTMNGAIAAELGGGTAPGGCFPAIGLNDTSSYAKVSAIGGTNCAIYLSSQGTGNVYLANASGTQATFANSSANTDVDSIVFRAASSTQPVLVQTGGTANLGLGTGAALTLAATTGYIEIPSMAGKNTGVPLNANLGRVAVYWDSTDLELCVYDTARHCSAAFAN